jgi:hypothetical protein
MNSKMVKSRSAGSPTTNGLVGMAVSPMQAAANRRGHGPETAGAGVGGLIGAMVGSFGGPLGAWLLGGLGAALGYAIANDS